MSLPAITSALAFGTPSQPILMKPYPNVNSCGATCSLELKTPRATCPHLPCDTPGSTPDDGDGDDEHPLARKRMKVRASSPPQMHKVPRPWITLGCSGSTLSTAPPCQEQEEYVDPIPLVLGCAGATEHVACAACQCCHLNSGAAHVTCCALEKATRGLNSSPRSFTPLRSLATTLPRWSFQSHPWHRPAAC